jgi:zinc finger SWIM domain-containing protein 3
MQNAVKHLSSYMDQESTLLAEFSACMYEHGQQEAFEEAFENMRGQVPTQTWMNSIYKVKEKWAECFMKNAFTLGMRSTQLSESLNNDLKHHLKSDLDIIRFFHHFERAVKVKRDVEINSEFDSRKYLPKIRMKTPMLVQVSKLYTPIIFEFFQKEYQRSMAACAEALDGQYEYMVKIGYPFEQPIFQEEWKVQGNRLEQKSSCGCGQFERLGVLCAHALKVLDLMNIKLLPEHYILKRWTREARVGSVQDSHGRIVVADPKADAVHRTNFLSHKFYNLVTEASNSEECCTLIEKTLDNLTKDIKERLLNAQVTPVTSTVLLHAQLTTPLANDSLAAARLKKKEVNKENKGSKRKKSWTERQYKGKMVGPSTATTPLSKVYQTHIRSS